jgi:hypothetical protein
VSNLARRRLIRQPWQPWEVRVIRRPGRVGNSGERWLAENYVNNRYSVQQSLDDAGVLHLWVRRHDGAMPSSWSDLQRIKDEVAGPERVAVQVFPARDDLVDQANLAHLWVYPAGHRLPFGLKGSP